jgi:hypothetical protein
MSKKFSLVEAKVQSVQSFDDGHDGTGSIKDLIGFFQRGEILPAWGYRDRLRQLREYYFHPRNLMVQGAFANLAKKQSSAPWEVSGPANASYWQDILANAQFGAGWDAFVQIMQLNFLRYDTGAYMEVIGPGPADGPLWGAVTGVAALDPLRCWPTGDPVYPVVYYDDDGGKHVMHHSRVHQIVDMLDGDARHPGWGTCALSRAISAAMREILMDRYINMSVDDKPMPGMMVVSGMMKEQFNVVLRNYMNQVGSDDMGVFGQMMMLFGIDPDISPTVTPVSFSTAPEKFDWVNYVELDAKLLALAIGVDPQDILPLSSDNLGTGTQTEILAAQARGKTEGDFRTKLTRAINWKVLPESYEFKITYQDDQSDLTRAQIAAQHAATIQTVSGALTTDEIRRYLVAVDDTFRDILSNSDGTVRNLADADPKTEAQVIADSESEAIAEAPVVEISQVGTAVQDEETRPENITAEDQLNDAQIDAAVRILDGVVDGSRVPSVAVELLLTLGLSRPRAEQMVDDTVAGVAPITAINKALYATGFKEWNQTRAQFIDSLSRTLALPTTGVRALAALKRRLRQALYRWGQMAFEDGLAEGGVDLTEATVADRGIVFAWLQDQEKFIQKLGDEIYPGQLTPAQASMKAALWANKSLREIHQQGIVQADKAGMRKWKLGATEQHCVTCLGLNGQVHRMETWQRAGLLPGVDKLDCKGYNCDCRLDKTTEKARGSLTAYKWYTAA